MAATSSSLQNNKFRSKLLFILILNLFYLHTSVFAISSNSKFSKFSRHPNSESSSGRTKRSTSSDDGFLNSVQRSLDSALLAHSLALSLTLSHRTSQTLMLDPVNDCRELLDDTVDMLSRIVITPKDHVNDDVHTWLSAALTNQETCKQSLSEKTSFNKHGNTMDSAARNLTGLLTNSLDMFVSATQKHTSSSGIELGGRKLLSESDQDFPTWVSLSDRKLLEASVEELRPHAVVAADGSGTHMSISEALASLEKGSGSGRSVIHLAAGTYKENLNIPSKQKNVMLVGDGKGKTVVIGSRSNRGGYNTYQTATVAAMGDGFIARDITFVNSAGPNAEQAVALRVGSDRSVVYRCSIDGYQDTLYTLSKRQFYRETDITGTVDFIFGNSAVVFQSCNIVSRKGSSDQNYVTAQGRSDPNQNTGISIHNCRITGSTGTYLGRPWKQYSRTVVMQSFLDGSIHPSGWSPWSSSFALKTLFYGEFGNSGPGSSVSGRVGWPGYHPALTLTEAQGFTVSGFIDGKSWLPSTGVVFDSGLL